MSSKIDHVILDGLNYDIPTPNMETLLKSKGLYQYMKITIPYPSNHQAKFVINGKKDEAVRVITTYIS